MRRLLPLLLVLPLLGCSTPGGGRPMVVVGAYPFAWLAQQLVGSGTEVVDLVKPGVEPHDVELTPRQIGQLEQARVVFYLKGFQPAVDDAVKGNKHAYDLGQAVTQLHTDGGLDPHVWLDPVLMQQLAAAMATDLRHRMPGDVSTVAVDGQLAALDKAVRAELTGCWRTEIVTSHAAFAYFSARYGLTQRGITGLSPESEPSPRRIAEVAAYARSHDVTTIFFESLVSPKVAETVASEVGARTLVLDPIESVRGSDDYLSVMRRNAATLHTALGCS